jgi:hypothetical protein
MTSAKPQSMAAQTEAPDDLIAELARLMADEARGDQPQAKEQPSTVRIPGEPRAEPAPRSDLSPSATGQAPRPAPTPVRIPGADTTPATPKAEPFSFDFGLSAGQGSTATSPAPAVTHAPQQADDTTTEPAEANLAPLDQDSLADLIAAELATDLSAPEPVAAPAAPETKPEPPPRSDDNFGMPPIFGLGDGSARPQAPTQAVERQQPAVSASPEPVQPKKADEPVDPLDEIERLVGPAVRMAPPAAAPASPALRSLATPTVATPAPANAVEAKPVAPKPAESAPPIRTDEMSSVDEAILAAAAATGAHVEWVNGNGRGDPDATPNETEALAEPRREPRRINRAVVGPLVAVGLLAVAGFGLYWVLGQGGTTTGPAPLLVADTTPTKEVPQVEETPEAPQSVVFNEISGANSGDDEQLVSRDQADTEEVVAANSASTSAGVLDDSGATTVDPNQDGLVNRKVRTVTVRPDGTIVSGDDSLAGSAILPVDRPDVPEVPGADFSTPDLIASAQTETPTPAAATETAPETPVPAASFAEPGSDIAVVDATGTVVPGSTVRVPVERPSDFAALASAAIAAANAAPAPVASEPVATPPAQQQAAATASGGSASAYVQLASQRSEEAARQSAQAIATRYGVLFGGASLEIQRVDLGERGIYYRVLVPANSRESAANICTNVKAAGGDCILL